MAGGPGGNGPVVNVHYKDVRNNTKDKWWEDASLRMNIMYCVGLCGTLFFNGCKFLFISEPVYSTEHH